MNLIEHLGGYQAAKEFLDSNDKIDNYPHLNIRVKELRKVTNLN